MNEEKPFVSANGPRSGVKESEITRTSGEANSYPISAIEEAVRSIRFGTVQIVIQDGRIVQIEKTEKIRLR